MKKGPSLSLSGLGQALTKFLWRYHIMLYTMTVLVGVAVAVFLLSNVILASPDAPTPQPDQSRFDDKTINLIDRAKWQLDGNHDSRNS